MEISSKQTNLVNTLEKLILNVHKPNLLNLINKSSEVKNLLTSYESKDSFLRDLRKTASFLSSISLYLNRNNQHLLEIYDTYYSLLSKDKTLDKIAQICVEYIRHDYPSISEKKSTSFFVLYVAPTEYISKLLVSFIVLSSVHLMKWPFNEVETANIISACTSYELYKQLKKYVKLTTVFPNVGIDLSHLNLELIVKKFNHKYFHAIFNDVVVAFFLYKNEELRKQFLHTIKLKTIVNKMKIHSLPDDIKKLNDYIEILKLLEFTNDKIIRDEKTKNLEEKIKLAIKDTQGSCFAKEKNYSSKFFHELKNSFQAIIDNIKVKLTTSGFYCNIKELTSNHENNTKLAYEKIIDYIAEDNPNEDITSILYSLIHNILSLRICRYIEKDYESYSLIEFIYSLSDTYLAYTLLNKLDFLSIKEISEKIEKLKPIVTERVSNIRTTPAEKMLSYLEKRFLEVKFSHKTTKILDSIKFSNLNSFIDSFNQAYSSLRRLYTNGTETFNTILAALIYVKQKAKQLDEASNEYYYDYFKKKIKQKEMPDIYKAILTEEIKDQKTLETIKGLYFITIILDTLKSELEQAWRKQSNSGLDIVIDTDTISILNKPNLIESIALAFISAELLKIHENRKKKEEKNINNSIKEWFRIILDNDEIPSPVGKGRIYLKDISSYYKDTYFLPPINTQKHKETTHENKEWIIDHKNTNTFKFYAKNALQLDLFYQDRS